MKNEAFSSIDFVGQCLVDDERTSAFQKVISKVVKKNDIVLDLGTGSGVMALFAARAGARKTFAVEYDSLIAKSAEINIRVNDFKKKIKLLVDDARKCSFPSKTKFNVVISEMLTTGMVDEPQVQVINNLHNKKLVNSNTIFLPSRQDTYISLVRANLKMFGLKIPMILHLWRWHKWSNLKISKMTNRVLLNSISFNKKNKEKFEAIISFKVKKTGSIKGVLLTSRTFLTDKIFLNDTEALNAPILIPIPKKFAEEGQELKLKISYIFSLGYKNFKSEFIV